jgi:hypothetical protein
MLLVARRSHWPDGTIHIEWVCPDCGKRCDTNDAVRTVDVDGFCGPDTICGLEEHEAVGDGSEELSKFLSDHK